LRELTVESFDESEEGGMDRRERSVRFFSSFVLAPIVFVVSALFMWNQPFEASGAISAPPRKERASSDLRHVTRIGLEYAQKFAVQQAPASPVRKLTAPISNPPTNRPPTAILGGVSVAGDRKVDLERQVYTVLKRYGKPIHNGKELSAAIVKEALLQEYDPVFVAAVIKSESAFNALAKSHKGAQGLMQIMPRTGAWLADQAAIPRGRLTDPGHNLKLGITYLKQLEALYGGNRVLTLIAYNWGPGHVESASTGKRRVPGEVMQYAIKILNDYRRWSSEVG
jgi:hypothetical protein